MMERKYGVAERAFFRYFSDLELISWNSWLIVDSGWIVNAWMDLVGPDYVALKWIRSGDGFHGGIHRM